MVDLATLALKIDSSEVPKGVSELDRLTVAGTKAEGAMDRLGDEVRSTGGAMKSTGAAASQMAAQAQRAALHATGMGNSSKLASHHVQNLAFQANDLFVGLASGQRPMTVFMQQGAQIAQIMAQAGIGVGGLTKAVGGMIWAFTRAHPILVGIAAAAGAVTAAFQMFQGQVEKSGELDKFANSLGLTKKEMEELGPVSVTFIDYLKAIWQETNAILGLDKVWNTFVGYASSALKAVLEYSLMATSGIYAGFVGTFKAIGIVWQNLPALIGEGVIAAANLVISVIEGMVNKAIALLNKPLEAVNGLLKMAGLPTMSTIGDVSFGRIGNSNAGATRQVGGQIAAGYSSAYNEAYSGQQGFWGRVNERSVQVAKDRLRGEANTIIGDRSDSGGGAARKHAKEVDEVTKAYEKALKAVQDFRRGIDEETASIGKNAIELHNMRTETAIAAAHKAALVAPTFQGAVALNLEAEALRKSEKAWEARTRAQADSDWRTNVIAPLDQELKLLGLVGPARDMAALAMEKEAFIAKALADGLTDVNGKWDEYYNKRKQIIEGQSALDVEAEKAQRLAGILDGIVGQMGQMGGAGGTIGGVLDGLRRGSFSQMGPAGALADMVLNKGAFTQLSKDFEGALKTTFGIQGEFGKTMGTLLAGAGTGMLAGSLLGPKGGGVGSAIGGALGEKLGEKFLSKGLESIAKGLGAAAGPIGSIVGGLLGGVFGGLFSKPTYGTASITSASQAATLAERGGAGGNANTAAGSVQGGLASIADRLGATLGSFNVSIGTFNDRWRVSTTGFGGQLDSKTAKNQGLVDFGDNSSAAIAFAIQDAIKDGALQGMRAGTAALLQNAKDLEAGLTKALRFEGVFTDLKAMLDPVGAAMDTLNKEFDSLRAIFAEAGASAADYAQLEQLYSLRKESAMLDAVADKRKLEIRILELTGRETEALAAAREMELAGMKESLRPLQQMIYTLEDARGVIDKFSPLSADLKAFRGELLGGKGASSSLSFLREQFRTTAGMAANGDAAALGNLRGVSTSYLDAARANAKTYLDFQNAMGEVLASVEQGIFAADSQIEYAQLQIDATKQVTAVLSSLRAETATMQAQIAENTRKTVSLWERFEGDGLTIKTAPDTPLNVETSEAGPLYVRVVE